MTKLPTDPFTLRQLLGKPRANNKSGTSLEDLLYGEPRNPTRREQAMWRAVILQMVTDAISRSRKQEARRNRREAVAWLTGNSRDFRTVCDLAGYDPHYLQASVRDMLDKYRLHLSAPAPSVTATLPLPFLPGHSTVQSMRICLQLRKQETDA